MSARLSSDAHSSERLAARRRQRRRRILISFCILLLLALAGAAYELNQSSVRISRVVVYGADQSYARIATDAMQGKYLGIIPRDSTFFFPSSRIRADTINSHPDVAAVSLFRNGLTGLSIKVSNRVAIARWCGLAPTVFSADPANGHGTDEYCYVFDASGYIYAAAASTTETLNSFSLYARLAGDVQEPLRATLADADQLPAAFDFARQLETLGSPVMRVIVRGDEVDDLLASGARVTYILGREQDAFTALVSAQETLNLADGSIEYVDLRFDGKVYAKRK